MVNLVLGFHSIVLWYFFFSTFYIVFCNSMKYICGPVSIEILCNLIQTRESTFCIFLCQFFLFLGAVFYPMTNLSTVPASVLIWILCFGVFPGDSFSGLLSKFAPLGLPLKPPLPLPLFWGL